MESQIFRAEIDRADARTDRFKVIALNDQSGDDVSDAILDPAVLYNDENALQFAVAGKLGLEFPDVVVELQDAK